MFIDHTKPGLIDSMSRTMDSFNAVSPGTLGGITAQQKNMHMRNDVLL